MATKPTLGYWDIRGLGESIRYMLIHKEVDYEDERIGDFRVWVGKKASLGLDFPNLPYYIDGGVKISQSLAIMRYVARKHGLCPQSEEETIVCEVVEQQFNDLRTNFLRLCYFDFDKKKDDFAKNLPSQIASVETFLADKQWVAGNRLTYVDFLAYETLDWLRLFEDKLYYSFPKVLEYMARFEALANLRAYLDRRPDFPIFAPFASWGGQGWKHGNPH